MTVEPIEMAGFERIDERKQLLDDAVRFVKATGAWDARYARQEASRTESLKAIEGALGDTNLRIVVIGEFSRGKSSLLNALLGDRILPTANEQTTAINTFIYGTKPGETPHLKVVYQSKPGDAGPRVERLAWETGSLEKWGTELDREHRDARREIERIEAYSDHPLLQKNVVFIDTPGFEGILAHHEDIARQAMDQAHVAIWIQSAEQLGGNNQEWTFLRESLAKNFNKFLTIINKWDLVLDPQDYREKELTQAERVERKLEHIRANFREKSAGVLDEAKIARLTDSRHLMGVSAMWAIHEDPLRRDASNIGRLARRIEEMCLEGEAQQQILAAPVSKLLRIQQNLEGTIRAEIDEIDRAEDIDKLRARLADLKNERMSLELEFKDKTNMSRESHRHWKEEICNTIKNKLIFELRGLKNEIEPHVTLGYIKAQLEEGNHSIGLPETLQSKFEDTLTEVDARWDAQRARLETILNDLRADYREQMQHVASDINEQLGETSLQMPELEISATVDLSAFDKYQQEAMSLANKQAELEENLMQVESQLSSADMDIEALELKRAHIASQQARVMQQRTALGSMPPPGERIEIVERSRKGFWGGIQEFWIGKIREEVVVPDYSNQDAYRVEKRALQSKIDNSDSEIQKIIEEQSRKRGEKISAEQARKKYERDLKRMERKLQEEGEKAQRSFEQAAEDALRQLRAATTGRLTAQIENLEDTLLKSVAALFDAQLEELRQQVETQYIEPMQTKQKMLEDTEALLEKGESEREERLRELHGLLEALKTLQGDTALLRDEIASLYQD